MSGLKVHCTYDTGVQTAFETGLVEMEGAIFLATDHDTIASDANTIAGAL